MKLKITLFLLLFSSSSTMGFEINTHQAITNCALSINCSQQGAENLNYFALTMQLNRVDYSDQLFEKYGKKYFEYVIDGEGLGEADPNQDSYKRTTGKLIKFVEGQTYLKGAKDKDGNISNLIDYENNSYISLIEAGSILEDALFHHPVKLGGCA